MSIRQGAWGQSEAPPHPPNSCTDLVLMESLFSSIYQLEPPGSFFLKGWGPGKGFFFFGRGGWRWGGVAACILDSQRAEL